MSSEIEISIVMAVYLTPRKFIYEAINSILTQSVINFEFIIVIDGDLELTNYLKCIKDNRIKILVNKVNKGLSYSLNKAIAYSKGKYIFRMDADDLSVYNRLDMQLVLLKKGKKLLSTRSILIDYSGEYKGESKKYPFHHYIRYFQTYFLHLNPVIHPSVAGIREIFVENPYDEKVKYGQDKELWFRISKQYKFYFMKDALIYYRIKNLTEAQNT